MMKSLNQIQYMAHHSNIQDCAYIRYDCRQTGTVPGADPLLEEDLAEIAREQAAEIIW